MTPKRIQCSRRAAWKTSEVVYVGRHVDRNGATTWYGRWGNPFIIKPVGGMFGVYYEDRRLIRWDTRRLAAADAVERYRIGVRHGEPLFPLLPEIRARLAGKDLACWCRLDAPCHADVLLELSNGEANVSVKSEPTKQTIADQAYRIRALESVLADRERELLHLKGPCSRTGCPLHYAHSGPCAPAPITPDTGRTTR